MQSMAAEGSSRIEGAQLPKAAADPVLSRSCQEGVDRGGQAAPRWAWCHLWGHPGP